jgi:hypothetical protein
VAPDFSTVLTGNAEKRDSIFSDLRRIYDGQLSKEYGTATAGPHQWRGRVTFIAAVTPAIDNYTTVFQSLGERFLLVRWPRADGVAAAEAAMTQDSQLAKSDLRTALQALFSDLPSIEPALPAEIRRRIAALAEFTVRARTHVQRSAYGAKEIIQVPEPESPTRLSQQLAQLAKGSALLSRHDAVDDNGYQLVRRASFDNIPPARRKIMEALLAGAAPRTVKLPASTRTYAIEELTELDLLRGEKVSEAACELLTEAGFVVPAVWQAKPASPVPRAS